MELPQQARSQLEFGNEDKKILKKIRADCARTASRL